MSLIVLNSKGNDPEHFTNSCSSGIKIPRNAEISLVSSNVQHRYVAVDQQIIEAGNNSFVFGIGSGKNPGTTTRIAGIDYTPHLPYAIKLKTAGNRYPIVLDGQTQITDFLEEQVNDTDNILASNYTGVGVGLGAWQVTASAAPTTALTIKCTGTVPDRTVEQGDTKVADIVGGLGYDNAGGPNNTTDPFNGKIEQGTVLLDGGVVFKGYGYAIDKRPIWNTNNYTVQGTWANNAGNSGAIGGGTYWDFTPTMGAGEEFESIKGMRGGLLESGLTGLDQPTNSDNHLFTPLTGGSNYAVWWEVTAYRSAGNITISFYYRDVTSTQGLRKVPGVAVESHKFGEITQPVANGASPNFRICMRCNTIVIGIAPAQIAYCIDVGYARATSAGVLSAILPATDNGEPGFIKITDPFANDGEKGSATAFNLYQRLPLRQGFSIPSSASPVLRKWFGTTHHDVLRRTAPTANISRCVFSTQRPLQNDYLSYKPDAHLQFLANKATLGDTFGCYNFTGWEILSGTELFTGPGLITANINTVTPYNDCLVVQCPTLQLNGLLGNQNGDVRTGTNTISAGGNPAPVLGVIPAPNTVMGGEQGQRGDRRAFFAQPVDNWISLNNTTPYVINQLEIKITDALGSKPNKLDGTSTIVIKIREHKRTATVVQGAGSNPQPINYL